MHISAEFAAELSDLLRIDVWLHPLKAVNHLKPLQEGHGRHEVHRKFECLQYLFLHLQKNLLLDHDPVCVLKQFYHDVERRMHGLLKFRTQQQAYDRQRRQAGRLLSLNTQVHKVSVGYAYRNEQRLLFVAFPLVQILY